MIKDLIGNASSDPVSVKFNMSKYNEGLLKALKQDWEDRAAKAYNSNFLEFVNIPCITISRGTAVVDPATGDNDIHLDWIWGRNYTPEETRRVDMGGVLPGTMQPTNKAGQTLVEQKKEQNPSEFWDDVYKKAFDSQQKAEEPKPVVDLKIKADTPDEQDRIWDLLKEAARG